MMFADDTVICRESRWRSELERRGRKASRSRTEYICVSEREAGGTVRLQGGELEKLDLSLSTRGQLFRAAGELGKVMKK